MPFLDQRTAESFRSKVSTEQGNTINLWQTAEDILFRYLQRSNREEWKYNLETVLGYELAWLLDEPGRFAAELRDNDILGIALCRLWYMIAQYPIPDADDIGAQAWLWKKWYNTSQGTGTTGKFVRTAVRLDL